MGIKKERMTLKCSASLKDLLMLDEEETIGVSLFASTPVTFTLGLGKTINTGGFSSVKVWVQVSIPMYPEEFAKYRERIAPAIEERYLAPYLQDLSNRVDKMIGRKGSLAAGKEDGTGDYNIEDFFS